MVKKKVLYLNPQGYNNLLLYDLEFITSTGPNVIDYVCNVKSGMSSSDNGKLNNLIIIPLFDYGGFPRLYKYMLSWRKVINLILTENYSVVHLQWLKVPVIDVLYLLLIRVISKDCRIVYTRHNIKEHQNSLLNISFFNKIFFSVFDEVFVHDTRALRYFRLYYPGFQFSKISHGPLKLNVEASRPPEQIGSSYYLFVGSESQYYKGPQHVRNFSKRLSPHESLVILGTFQNLSSKSLVLNRYVTDEEMVWLIMNAKAVYMPYEKSISQSAVAWLAIGYGTSIIMNDIYLRRYLKDECNYSAIYKNKEEIGNDSTLNINANHLWRSNEGIYG